MVAANEQLRRVHVEYAVSSEFDPKKTKPWVQENVLPYLPTKGSSAWKPLKAIAREFTDFVGEEPSEFWSLIATYDRKGVRI